MTLTKCTFVFEFNYTQKEEVLDERQAVDDFLLCVRDDTIGYLEGKRPFPCKVSLKKASKEEENGI